MVESRNALDAVKSCETLTDWERLRAMTDADIDRAIAADPDAAPALSPEQLQQTYRPAPARILR